MWGRRPRLPLARPNSTPIISSLAKTTLQSGAFLAKIFASIGVDRAYGLINSRFKFWVPAYTMGGLYCAMNNENGLQNGPAEL